MTEWQPIETAPRDGTMVRIWLEPTDKEFVVPAPKTGAEYSNIVFGAYPHAEDSFYSPSKLAELRKFAPDIGASYGFRGTSSKYKATHWMPLPEPPESK